MLYKQRISNPYKLIKGKKHTTFNLRNFAGVYIIYKNAKPVYIGFSASDVYKALYRHFESWNDKRQIRITYNPNLVKVRIVYCKTSDQADRLEKALILKHKPKDNPNKYELFEADEKEKAVLLEYMESDTEPIAEYENEIPF